MVKNTVKQTKNTSPVRSGALIVSLLIQLAALTVIGIVSLHYGVVAIIIALLLAIGYVILVLQTLKFVQNNIGDSSTLTAIHMIASVVGVLIVAGFMAIFTNLSF